MTAFTLTEFLLARIAEDEAVAERAEGPYGIYADTWWGQPSNMWSEDAGGALPDKMSRAEADLIARYDPSRVLAECAAKRRIVAHLNTVFDHFEPDPIAAHVGAALCALAQPYADHPDFNPDWA